MLIRPYQKTDEARLIDIFRENIPGSFDASEEADLINYLRDSLELYYVLEINGRAAGAGGINFFEDRTMASLSWDFFSTAFQGQGMGRTLATYRIEVIKKVKSVRTIRVRTTQIAYAFYEKMGFQLQYSEKDYWAKGYDLYYMTMSME